VPAPPVSLRVTSFFESYRGAFEAMDPAGIAGHFSYPCQMVSEADEIRVTAIRDREEWQAQIERLVSIYRTLGVHSADILEIEATEVSARITQVVIHWALRDKSGDDVYNFHAGYTLIAAGPELWIAAIAHDEMPRLQGLMGKRNAPRSSHSAG
jgi:hypothetical protein